MDAPFDSANKRYGMPARLWRAYHACSSGLVEESRRYGAPTVTASSARMRSEGLPAATVFHAALGTIGNAARLAANTPICSHACFREGSFSCSQCAYR
jgi:hypothetical protein